jgi:parvulin-like peptidyl-prolyl isomerase
MRLSRDTCAVMAALTLLMVALPARLDAQASHLSAGTEAPEISAETWINTEPVSLEQRNDQVTVVEFWATWCGPCRRTAPHLNQLHEKYGEQGLKIVGLSNEDEETVREFVEKMDLKYAIGAGSQTAQQYKVSAIPTAFVVKNGEIKWAGSPMDPAMESEIRKQLGIKWQHDDAVAVVNGRKISPEALKQRVEQDTGQEYGDVDERLRRRVLEQMVVENVLTQHIKDQEAQATEEQVKERFEQERQRWKEAQGDPDQTFEEFLKANNLPPERLRELLALQIGLENAVGNDLDEQTLRDYYEQNKQQLQQVKASHILLETNDMDEEQKAEARQKLEDLRQKIQAGELSFDEAATEHSEGPSGPRGGELGWFGRGQMTPKFEEAAFEAEEGEVTPVVETPFGLHIIQVEDRRESFAELEQTIRERLLQERINQEAGRVMAEADIETKPQL